MPAPAWENLDAFLGLHDFGVQARLLFATGATRTVAVIFDEAFFDTTIGEYALEATQPRALGKEVDLADLRRGDRVAIGGITYDVTAGPQEDGTGMATVPLQRPTG
ncbi:head-tail joining protein [Paracoccus homiensis]|uniref:head-tail joining protein n=1 Tax=Paracoccus homiensis TaxID=364199 RepID=UPI00398C8A8C